MKGDKKVQRDLSKYSQKLKALGLEHEILEHPESKKVDQIQNYLNLAMSDVSPTLIMKADKRNVAIIKRGDCKIDYEKVKRLLGALELRMADKDEFKALTGVPIGAARLYNPGFETLIDEKVLEKEYIVGGSGTFSNSIRYKTSDLTKIPESEVVDISEMNKEASKIKRVFSGSRPTGRLHLGNYLGAIKGYIALQERGDLDCIYCVVDLHGITTPYDPKTFQESIYNVVLDYLGAGLDPSPPAGGSGQVPKCHLLIQSQVPEHVELAYLLGTIYPVSRIEQLPTYKDKKRENPDYVNVGLFYYPILMASDILIYKANLVPVGKDQFPHIELTREVARKFNQMFAEVFPEPEAFESQGSYVPSLTGTGKMSKSVEGSYINLTDDLEAIQKKLSGAPTDSGKGTMVPKEGGVVSLLTLVELFEGEEKRKRYEAEYLSTGIKYQAFKEELAEAIYNELKPIQERRKYFEEHPEEVKKI
ncbi:MAG: tryptophan--tRNA ligase, partial [bacterium]|nr:tryptophan--tRNA ligase [bacterium]